MSKLMDLTRELRRRRAGIDDRIMLVRWKNFDERLPCEAYGLQQGADESYEEFTDGLWLKQKQRDRASQHLAQDRPELAR